MELKFPDTVELPECRKFLQEYQSYPEIDAQIAVILTALAVACSLELVTAKHLLNGKINILKNESGRIYDRGLLDNSKLPQNLREASASIIPAYNLKIDEATKYSTDLSYVTDLLDIFDKWYYYFRDIYRSELHTPTMESNKL